MADPFFCPGLFTSPLSNCNGQHDECVREDAAGKQLLAPVDIFYTKSKRFFRNGEGEVVCLQALNRVNRSNLVRWPPRDRGTRDWRGTALRGAHASPRALSGVSPENRVRRDAEPPHAGRVCSPDALVLDTFPDTPNEKLLHSRRLIATEIPQRQEDKCSNLMAVTNVALL
jgi:hypothetical protein